MSKQPNKQNPNQTNPKEQCGFEADPPWKLAEDQHLPEKPFLDLPRETERRLVYTFPLLHLQYSNTSSSNRVKEELQQEEE